MPSPRTLRTMPRDPLRTARVVAGTTAGTLLVTAGLVMLLTPGPGIIAIAAGTALLARHHEGVARLRTRWVDRIRRGAVDAPPAGGAPAADPDAA